MSDYGSLVLTLDHYINDFVQKTLYFSLCETRLSHLFLFLCLFLPRTLSLFTNLIWGKQVTLVYSAPLSAPNPVRNGVGQYLRASVAVINTKTKSNSGKKGFMSA